VLPTSRLDATALINITFPFERQSHLFPSDLYLKIAALREGFA
jgi:hypothetical protein